MIKAPADLVSGEDSLLVLTRRLFAVSSPMAEKAGDIMKSPLYGH